MLSHLQTEDIVDITSYPIPDPNFSNYENCIFGKRQITLPDLHGNGLKNLWTLVYYGIFQISPEDYLAFETLYYTPIEFWSSKELQVLTNVLAGITINEKAKNNVFLRFIGDETGDRGVLDLINLLIFLKLHDNNIPFNILVSNHGMELVYCYEKNIPFNENKARKLPDDFRISLANLQKLIPDFITREYVDDLIKSVYLPHLQLLDYSVNQWTQKLTLYTHAASDDELLALDQQLNKALGIVENEYIHLDLSKDDVFIRFLNNLNDKFNVLKDNNQIHILYVDDSPFDKLIWNREEKHLKRNPNRNFVNGHQERITPKKNNVYEIDCSIGKALPLNEGSYILLNSYDVSGEDLNLIIKNESLNEVSKQMWDLINTLKAKVHQSFSQSDFITQIKKIDNTIDFMEEVLNTNRFYSHYQVNNLKYLFIEKKNEFMNLFKTNDNAEYNMEALKQLINITTNNELTTLLDIATLLMKNDLYSNNSKLIFNLVLKHSENDMTFLKVFHRFFLLLNEYAKPTELNIEDIMPLLEAEPNVELLMTNYKNFHENIVYLPEYSVNFDSLLDEYTHKDYKKCYWIIKMLSLSGATWEKHTEKQIQSYMAKRTDDLINGLIKLAQSKSPYKKGMIDKLRKLIQRVFLHEKISKSFLESICQLIISLPKSLFRLYLFDHYSDIFIKREKTQNSDDANRYIKIINVLENKAFHEIKIESSSISLLLDIPREDFDNTIKLLNSLTKGLSSQDCQTLGELIFTDSVDMGVMVLLSERLKYDDTFSSDMMLELISTLAYVRQSLSSQDENLFIESFNIILPALNISTSLNLFQVVVNLLDEFKNNEFIITKICNLLSSENLYLFLVDKESSSDTDLTEFINGYFDKKLNAISQQQQVTSHSTLFSSPRNDSIIIVTENQPKNDEAKGGDKKFEIKK